MRPPAIGPPTRLATTAERRSGDADFERVGQAKPLGDDRRPGDGGAVAADQGGGAEQRRHPLRQAERRDAARRDQVLQREIGERQGEQDQERPAARDQVVELGVEADAGEEMRSSMSRASSEKFTSTRKTR